MGGGLMQLVAYGAQDVYLTGDPQITFFKVVYRRHTNFSMESIAQTFNGTPDFGRKVSATIARNGDLIHKCYLQVTLPDIDNDGGAGRGWVPYVGHRLVNNVELEIGGQKIDKHYGEWLYIWSELTETEGHRSAYDTMVGHTGDASAAANQDNDLAAATNGLQSVAANESHDAATLYIPLQFWFCRNAGLALPLIALQYHEVKINVEFETQANCTYGATPTGGETSAVGGTTSFDAQLYVDYIYLDTEERRRFAQVKHEYLIEQLQFTGSESVSNGANKLRLNFNHPVKELIWTVHSDVPALTDSTGDWNNYSTTSNVDDTAGIYYSNGANNCTDAKLQLNGHDRFAQRNGAYFNLVQPYQHHTSSPSQGINCYSFALKPEEHQPSGTCNFSRIDNATLNMTVPTVTTAGTAKIYAVNYNVLRVMSGMGGIAYTN